MVKDYEEYEQYPTSPWSQSPAPSPAIQADEETNPFFTPEGQHVEDSFNPTSTPKDYSQLGQVEAIGVERASTVIHIPLVHPTLSQPMPSLRMHPPSSDRPGPPRQSSTLDVERKAPIAILSILTSAVPYPHNLTQSLKMLGPHLATSYAIAQQFSASHYQPITIRHRRTASGNQVTDAPMTIEPTSLADIVNAEIEGALGSISGSVTSPSEYSNRSRYSPAGSIVGTPGWDPATHGWTAGKSVSGTPGPTVAEMVDNYFEAKKRSNQRSGSSSSAQIQGTPAKPGRRIPHAEAKSNAQKSSPTIEGEPKFPQSDRKSKASQATKEERTLHLQTSRREASPPRSGEAPSPQRSGSKKAVSATAVPASDRRHSVLHSYGADFNASFGALPSPSVEAQTPGAFGHAREGSFPEEMPPPSDRLLRTVIDSVPVQIFTAQPDTGTVTWVNSKFMVYRAQDAKEVLENPWQAIHPDDRDEFMSSWHRSLRTAQQLQQKVRLQRFDNSFRWFYVRAAPLKDKRQKIVHWIGTMMDFHDQHNAEINSARQQETAASEAKYRALANSSPQVVFAVNKVKGVTFCNSQWVQYSGQKEAQALGVGFMDHVHPDDLAKCRLPTFDEESNQPTNVPTSLPPELHRKQSTSASSSDGSSETEKGTYGAEASPISPHLPQRKLSELASTGILKITRDADGRPSYSTEVRLKSKDGDYRWHLVRILLAEPALQDENEKDTWYGTCTDINDHKALERDLKETMDEKSRFLSNMSHEIRTPLNGIIGMVNFLIDSSLTAEQLEHVNIIRASTEGLRGLINDILDLSKAEAGMINLVMDWLYVRALIEEVNDLTSTMAIDKGIELNYLVEDDVPAQIKGDRFRIRQVLLNIIGNAIKFTQQGEVFVRCSTHQADRGELEKNELYIKFDVIDTGRGFNENEAEHLFKRFSQIDGSSTRQHGGTGLGLVISRQLAQLHGGDMSARGSPGKGSTFTLFIKTTLPSKTDQPPPPPTPGSINIPILPMSPGPAISPHTVPKMPFMATDYHAKASPKFAIDHRQSPLSYASSPDVGRESPSVSSASSDPSLRSVARTSSLRSERSSASSFIAEPSVSSPPMKLSLPGDSKLSKVESVPTDSAPVLPPVKRTSSSNLPSPDGSLVPPMYSILVLCPLKYSREATVQHIEKTLPSNVPHQITARDTLAECQKLMGGEDPVRFTHIALVLQDIDQIATLMDQILNSQTHQATSIVIVTDLAQRRALMEHAPKYNYEKLASERRLLFIFKPLKPSRFAIIFDPQKEREMSTDRNQDSAQQIAKTQKQVFDELTNRLGNRGKRVLLVEDNRTNQLVNPSFLSETSNIMLMLSTGCPQIPLQGLDRLRDRPRRRRMHQQSFLPPARLLLHHPLRPAHAEQGRLRNVLRDPQMGTLVKTSASADHCAVRERVGRCVPEVRRGGV
jgi:PAS domain S-box-containing protein